MFLLKGIKNVKKKGERGARRTGRQCLIQGRYMPSSSFPRNKKISRRSGKPGVHSRGGKTTLIFWTPGKLSTEDKVQDGGKPKRSVQNTWGKKLSREEKGVEISGKSFLVNKSTKGSVLVNKGQYGWGSLGSNG